MEKYRQIQQKFDSMYSELVNSSDTAKLRRMLVTEKKRAARYKSLYEKFKPSKELIAENKELREKIHEATKELIILRSEVYDLQRLAQQD